MKSLQAEKRNRKACLLEITYNATQKVILEAFPSCFFLLLLNVHHFSGITQALSRHHSGGYVPICAYVQQ